MDGDDDVVLRVNAPMAYRRRRRLSRGCLGAAMMMMMMMTIPTLGCTRPRCVKEATANTTAALTRLELHTSHMGTGDVLASTAQQKSSVVT